MINTKSFLILIFLCVSYPAFSQVGFVQEGNASYYADSFEGRLTASGERYNHLKATCAHVSIPFGALVKITNLENNQTAIARVNDRGPFVPGRIIDVSMAVAKRLGMIEKGIARVQIEVVDNMGNIPQDNPEVSKLKSKPQEQEAVTNQQTTEKPQVVKPSQNPKSEGNNPEKILQVDVEARKGNGFFVQLGSFKDQANVLNLVADAQKQTGEKIFVQTVVVNNEKIFKVMLGEYRSRAEAERVRERTLKKYPGCFIIEIK